MQIDYYASDDVGRMVEAIGRTEDVRFSPGGNRLAVAAAGRDRVAVFDIEIATASASPAVRLTGAVEIASPCLKYPHGLEFIDDATLAVGSRFGDVAVFALPPAGGAAHECALEPLHVLPAGPKSSIRWPGSLAVAGRGPSSCELLICNNFRHSIARHVIEQGSSATDGEIFLTKWLDVPDGICVSGDGRWIAISNHWTHNVLIYENQSSPVPARDPDGILRSMHHPHGVRFSADGRHLFVADAGAPYVHIYASETGAWKGVRSPMISFKVMDDAAFMRGRVNVHEGGPKGVDLDKNATVLVVTSEHQPLAFFDVTAILRAGPLLDPSLEMQVELATMEMMTGFRRELHEIRNRLIQAEGKAVRLRASAEKAKAKAAKARGRWPIAAPLRRLYAALSRPN